jgi:hypothetical protein
MEINLPRYIPVSDEKKSPTNERNSTNRLKRMGSGDGSLIHRPKQEPGDSGSDKEANE